MIRSRKWVGRQKFDLLLDDFPSGIAGASRCRIVSSTYLDKEGDCSMYHSHLFATAIDLPGAQ